MFLYIRSGRRVWQAGVAPQRGLRIGDTFEAAVKLQHRRPDDQPVKRKLRIELIDQSQHKMYAVFA